MYAETRIENGEREAFLFLQQNQNIKAFNAEA